MKQLRPYLLFSVVSFVIAVSLSVILQFSLTNTWQAAVALPFVFGPYVIYGWKMASKLNERQPTVCLVLRLVIFLFVFGYILATIFILF